MEFLIDQARDALADRKKTAAPDQITLACTGYLAGILKSMKNGGATRKQVAQDWGLKGLGGGGALMAIREVIVALSS